MGIIRIIRIIRYMGILNFILFWVALFGILACIPITVMLLLHPDNLTTSEIADIRKETIPFETLTEKQLQEGTMVEGNILINMGEFAKSVDDNKRNYEHYAILLDDKVMSISTYDSDDQSSLGGQASNYRLSLALNKLSFWENRNSKKKSKKNKKIVEQVIQKNKENALGVTFKGKVVIMDGEIEDALRNYIVPSGGTEPAFEVIPYEIKCAGYDKLGEIILFYIIFVLGDIVGIAALCIFTLRMRAHNHFP